MTPEEIRIAVFTHMDANWGTADIIEIDYPNTDFNAPKDDLWMNINILMGDSFVKEVGERGIGLRVGTLMVNIFAPPNTGTKKTNYFANVIETIFARADADDVNFDEPSTNYLGVDDSGYYHTVVSIPFNCWIGEDR